MVPLLEIHDELAGTDGFSVESPNDRIGLVEDVRLEGRNRALAVRLRDGRRALLLEEDVETVDRENRWVVVPSQPRLLEATTGTVLAPLQDQRPRSLAQPQLELVPEPLAGVQRPLWQMIAILYGTIFLLGALLVTVAFTVAWLVAGAPY